MRVIAGRFGGRRLKSASVPGLRPTSDRVRESLFSILGRSVVDARVLDLYAGTGALALEALSRGARAATCVERAGGSLSALESNVAALGLEGRVRIVRDDSLSYCRRIDESTEQFEVVFADPPYDSPLEPLVRDVVDRRWWTTVCVIEHAGEREVPEPESDTQRDVRRYGDTSLTFLWRP